MMHNTLFLKRLLIYTSFGHVAYDEKFHKGINIIRGDNSSGKSTIAHFIFYVLGGAFNNWTDEAKQCNEVLAEVELNGIIMTFKRPVAESGNQPMFVYLGEISDAVKVSITGQWQKYSYNASDNKISFSNFLFESLNIPIVYGDNNITMHQLLRLLYIDQDSPTNSFFLYEQFDSGLTRQTVADLLLGVYDSSLYSDRIEKKESENRLTDIQADIKGMRKIYEDKRLLDSNYVHTLIGNNEVEIRKVDEEIINLRENKKRVNFRTDSKLNFQKLNEQVLDQRNIVNELNNYIRRLKYEVDDSEYFIETLEHKKSAIQKSISTRKYFQNFPFKYCPECLSELETPAENHCKLCKQEISDSQNGVIVKRMLQEISFQIKESKKLLKFRYDELNTKMSEYEAQSLLLREYQVKVNSAMQDVKSFKDEKIDELLILKGALEGEMLQYANMLEIAERYELYINDKSELEKKINKLSDSINTKEAKQHELGVEIRNSVERYALNLLKSDLNREEGFKEAKSLEINYYDNAVYVDDKKKRFSASSDFYLKNTSRFSLFFSSLLIDSMRFPRFILCDNMEDKGIEKERAQNFQRLIIDTAQNSQNKEFQIIYTTSYIPEEIEGSDYCVGDYYSEETNNKSLKHVKSIY